MPLGNKGPRGRQAAQMLQSAHRSPSEPPACGTFVGKFWNGIRSPVIGMRRERSNLPRAPRRLKESQPLPALARPGRRESLMWKEPRLKKVSNWVCSPAHDRGRTRALRQ